MLTVDHAPESPSKYMTTIYHYFCIKNEYFYIFYSKKFMKICSKTHQITPLKKIVACNLPSPPKSCPPHVQIMHTPMDY